MADGSHFVGSYTSPSDHRLKTNIRRIENSLDKVSEIRGVSFSWNEDMSSIHHRKNTEYKELGMYLYILHSRNCSFIHSFIHSFIQIATNIVIDIINSFDIMLMNKK